MASRRLEVVIAGDASGATRALGQVGAKTEKTARSMSGLRRVGGALAGVFATIQIGQFLRGAISEAEEAATALRQTNAVIESTGGVAGVTADHLVGLADRLSRLAGVDDELIQSGGNVLLTFRNIKAEGGIFDDALSSALDMSSALGTDLQGNVMAVGKALNDPAEGLARLTRMGVTFSDSQRTAIEQMAAFGNTAGAQRIILDELATEFGGSAEANATATGQMTVAWENLKETIGTLLLPAVDDLAAGLSTLVDWFDDLDPAVQKVVSGFVALTIAGAAFQALGLASTLGSIASVLGKGLYGALAIVLSPIGIIIAGLATTAAIMYGVWLATQPLRDAFFAVVDALTRWWAQADGVKQVMNRIGSITMDVLRGAMNWIINGYRLWWELAQPVRSVLNIIGAIGMYALRSAVANVLATVRAWWAVTTPLRSAWAAIGGFALSTLKSALAAVRSAVQTIWDKSGPVRDVLRTIGGIGLGVLKGALDAIRSAVSSISSGLDSVASKIRNLPTPSDAVVSGLRAVGSPLGLLGHAEGTMSAPAGLALVGEKGPELVMMRGGERVFTASQTRRMAGRGGGDGGDVVVPITLTLDDGTVLARRTVRVNRRDHRAYNGADGMDY